MKINYIDKYVRFDNLIMALEAGYNYKLMIDIHAEYNFQIPKDYLDLYMSIYNEKRIDREKLDYFFKNFPVRGRYNSLGKMLEIMMVFDGTESFEECIEAFRNVDVTVMKERLIRNYFGKDNEEKVLERVASSNMDDALKWRVYYALHHLKEVCVDLADFLLECDQLLRERLTPFDDRTKAWGRELYERAINDKDPKHGLFLEILEIMKVNEASRIHLGPQGILPFNFEYIHKGEHDIVYVFLGEYSDRILASFMKNQSDEWLVDIAKLLQEEKRLALLNAYADAQPSGVELSKRLGISQSTVTHHLTNLIISKVIIEKVDPEAYRFAYRPNRELLSDWCKFAQDKLGLEGEGETNAKEIYAFFKCFSDPVRWEMLKAIAKSPMSSADLRAMTGISAGTVTHHMNLMSKVGIIDKSKEGRTVYFTLNRSLVTDYLSTILAL